MHSTLTTFDGVHAVMPLALSLPDESVSTHSLAKELEVSEAHLMKVLHALARVGLPGARRGPRGWLRLRRSAEDLRPLEVFEPIEGPLLGTRCLLGRPRCDGRFCVLGGLPESVQETIRSRFSSTRLSGIRDGRQSFIRGPAHEPRPSTEVSP